MRPIYLHVLSSAKPVGDLLTGIAIEETHEAVRSSSERISLLRSIGASPAMIKETGLNAALGKSLRSLRSRFSFFIESCQAKHFELFYVALRWES